MKCPGCILSVEGAVGVDAQTSPPQARGSSRSWCPCIKPLLNVCIQVQRREFGELPTQWCSQVNQIIDGAADRQLHSRKIESPLGREALCKLYDGRALPVTHRGCNIWSTAEVLEERVQERGSEEIRSGGGLDALLK